MAVLATMPIYKRLDHDETPRERSRGVGTERDGGVSTFTIGPSPFTQVLQFSIGWLLMGVAGLWDVRSP
jgi:hypothetical protein